MSNTIDSHDFQSVLADVDDFDRDLLTAASEYYHHHGVANAVREAIRNANSSQGTDFATALLYTHFLSKLGSVSKISDTAPGASSSPHRKNSNSDAPFLVVVPGAFHREHPEAGGDGRLVKLTAERNGWECVCLPTESLGTLDLNAQAIIHWLEQNREKRIVVVSLSKGTADLMVTLTKRPDLAKMIVAWISVSGILLGTEMSNWLLDRKRLRPVLWFMRWKHRAGIQAVQDLRAGDDARLPDDYKRFRQSGAEAIPTFHLVGFPLKRHLSSWRARLWHQRLQRAGPNDSVILLEDMLRTHGTVIPVWGADHYLKSPWDPTEALQRIIEWVAD